MAVYVCNGLMLKGNTTVLKNGTCDLLITSELLIFDFSATQELKWLRELQCMLAHMSTALQ